MVRLSVLLLVRVPWRPTNWPPRVTIGAGTTRTRGTIPGVISHRTTRKYRCYCRIVSLDSSWYPPKAHGTSTSWVSFVEMLLLFRDRTLKLKKTHKIRHFYTSIKVMLAFQSLSDLSICDDKGNRCLSWKYCHFALLSFCLFTQRSQHFNNWLAQHSIALFSQHPDDTTFIDFTLGEIFTLSPCLFYRCSSLA